MNCINTVINIIFLNMLLSMKSISKQQSVFFLFSGDGKPEDLISPAKETECGSKHFLFDIWIMFQIKHPYRRKRKKLFWNIYKRGWYNFMLMFSIKKNVKRLHKRVILFSIKVSNLIMLGNYMQGSSYLEIKLRRNTRQSIFRTFWFRDIV